MTIKNVEYFYDRQQIRFLEQFVRAFSGFQYMTGSRAGQPPALQVIPCRMATTNRMVASILRNNSENSLLTVPMITIFQSDLTYAPERLQNPHHIDTRQIVEREIDANGNYGTGRGRSYTISRLMPRPFDMKIQVDIWTSNQDQQYQILEQILVIFAPSFDIQNSDNALDWSAKTTATLESVTRSSKTIPVGTENEIDISTLTFVLPIWLSPPAIVTEQNLIEQINTNIYNTNLTTGVIQDEVEPSLISTTVTSIGNHHISIDGNKIKLLGENSSEVDSNGNLYDWKLLIDQYGTLNPTISKIIIKSELDTNNGIIGTIQYDPNNKNELFWQIDADTLPSNTLPPVNAVVDPFKVSPNNELPAPVNGVRYLLLHDIASSPSWGTVNASYGDIIQYNNGSWYVIFDASAELSSIQYVLNLHSGKQLKFSEGVWVLAIDGEYPQGLWRFLL